MQFRLGMFQDDCRSAYSLTSDPICTLEFIDKSSMGDNFQRIVFDGCGNLLDWVCTAKRALGKLDDDRLKSTTVAGTTSVANYQVPDPTECKAHQHGQEISGFGDVIGRLPGLSMFEFLESITSRTTLMTEMWHSVIWPDPKGYTIPVDV